MTVSAALPHASATLLSYTYSGVSGPNPVTASNAGSFFGNPYNNTATASAAPKQIHLSATNNGSAATEFSGASANGGWNDNYTLHLGDPGLVVSGTSGYWVAPVHVDGTLIGAIGSLWDYQLVAWGADQSIPGGLSVDQTVLFAIPVTFAPGQQTTSLQLGIYAAVEAGTSVRPRYHAEHRDRGIREHRVLGRSGVPGARRKPGNGLHRVRRFGRGLRDGVYAGACERRDLSFGIRRHYFGSADGQFKTT